MTAREYLRRCELRYWRRLDRNHAGCVMTMAEEAGVNRTQVYVILRRLGMRRQVVGRGNAAWQALGH